MLPKNSAVVIAGASTQYRNADSSHAFRQDSNFWYLSGFNEAESTLVLLVNEKNNVKSIAFVPEKDELKEIWDGYRAGPEGAMKDHDFDLAFNNTEIDQRLPDLLAGHNQVFYPVGKSKTLDADIIEWIKSAKSKDRHSSAIDIADASSKVGNQRLIKDEDEIKIMKKACQISAEAHVEAMKFVKPGMTEQEMEAFYQYEFSKRGGRFSACTPIVAGGENACVLHYVENSKPLKDSELLLVDAGCEFELYASDITRTFPINGKFNDAQREIYDLVLSAQKSAIQSIRPGVSSNKPHETACQIITDGLIKLGIMKSPEDLTKFYMHNTGHWLGLDVHDVGSKLVNGEFREFKSGMVTTVEPGIYIRRDDKIDPKYWGIGVRIEDDVLVTDKGNHVLSQKAAKEINEIEQLMSRQ